jgi:D-xylose transport system substrate-binding protein
MIFRKLKALLRIALCIICLSSCLEKKQNSSSLEIGILLNEKDNYYREDAELMIERAEQRGVNIIFGESDGNSYSQYLAARKMINRNVGAIILSPVNSKTSATIGKLCQDNNVLFVGYNKMPEFTHVDLCLTYDYHKVGQMQITEITEGEEAISLAILAGPTEDYTSYRIREGNLDALNEIQSKKAITLVYDQWAEELTVGEGYKMTENLFEIYDSLDVIITHHPNLAAGVSQYLIKHNMQKSVKLVGALADQNTIARLKNNQQALSIALPSKSMAYTAIDATQDLYNGRLLDRNTYVNNGKVEVPTLIFDIVPIRPKDVK